MRALEAQRGGHETETVRAVSVLLWARYIEWFRRDNRKLRAGTCSDGGRSLSLRER